MATDYQTESHLKARKVVCRRCCVKVGSKGYNPTDGFRALYDQFFGEEWLVDADATPALPTVLCASCRFFLTKRKSGDEKAKPPQAFPWPS